MLEYAQSNKGCLATMVIIAIWGHIDRLERHSMDYLRNM